MLKMDERVSIVDLGKEIQIVYKFQILYTNSNEKCLNLPKLHKLSNIFLILFLVRYISHLR